MKDIAVPTGLTVIKYVLAATYFLTFILIVTFHCKGGKWSMASKEFKNLILKFLLRVISESLILKEAVTVLTGKSNKETEIWSEQNAFLARTVYEPTRKKNLF